MNGKVSSRACNRLSKELKWTAFGPHALRRTFASRMAAQGTSIELLERYLSHDITHGRAIAHYAHYSYRDEKRRVIELWEATLLAILKGAIVGSHPNEQF
jgi:integrase